MSTYNRLEKENLHDTNALDVLHARFLHSKYVGTGSPKFNFGTLIYCVGDRSACMPRLVSSEVITHLSRTPSLPRFECLIGSPT